jgi:hypothetical protein
MLKPDAQIPELSWLSLAGGVLFLGFSAVALLLLLVPRDSLGPTTADGVAGAIALGGLYATPGILALLSARRRALLAAAGAMGLILLPTSMSITPLLFVPSVLVLFAYGRARPRHPPRLPVGLLVVASLVVAATSFAAITLGPRMRCWSRAGGSGCSNDVIPPVRSLGSLALEGLFVVAAAKLAKERDEP